MNRKAFFQNFLVRISSALSVVFLVLGTVFIAAAFFNGDAISAVGFFVMVFAVATAVASLVATNFSMLSLNSEIKDATFTADKIAQGEIFYNLDDDEESELRVVLKHISVSIAEKSRIVERIAAGDLSEDPVPNSETDILGQALLSMVVKLRDVVQTEREREQLRFSVQKLLQEIGEVATGNLTVRSESAAPVTDEIADAFDAMTGELRLLVKEIKNVSGNVGASAASLNETTLRLTRGSEAQSTQISRTSSALEEMCAQIREVSENAALSVQVAGDSLNSARYGTKAAQDNINAINSIRNQVQETSKRIKRLGERSQEISQIVGLIDDLSDRTGLLALNAGLQAAGAGEAGRGFAVVADEVERLAERSNQLTQQIAALAQTIQIETKDVVASMEETIHEVVVGSTLADKAGQSLTEIERVSGRLSELLQSIAEATGRQAVNSNDISNAMIAINKVTEIVSESTARAADSAKNLLALTDRLHNATTPFKLPEDKFPYRKTSAPDNEIYLH